VVNPATTRNVKAFQFVKIIIYILAFAHLIGCFYYFLARILDFDQSTWIHAMESAVPHYRHQGSDISGDYLLIVFKGFCRVANQGYDSDLPGNISELVWAIIVMWSSVYVSSMILGTLLTFLVRRDPMDVAHKERMEALEVYMRGKRVPEDLYETVMRYCNFQYNKTRQNDAGGNDLINSLSQSLRIEVGNSNHGDLISKCCKIGRPLHRCSEEFLNELVVRLYTVYVMPGDNVVRKDEIPRELFFVSSGCVQVVDEHDQVVSVIRSDVPDTAPIVGEVPFFLGINYLKTIKASLDRDVQLEVLSRESMTELTETFPEDHNTICNNLWSQFDISPSSDAKPGPHGSNGNNLNLDNEKLLIKKRIEEARTFRKEQQFNALSKAAHTGDIETVLRLAHQGANLNEVDYDGKTALHMACSAGRYKIVESLLKLGVEKNIKDRWGQTPMSIAITTKQQMIITVLAGHNARLDIASPELELCSAAASGDLVKVKRLVEFGVNPNGGDYDKRTAIHVASAEGHEKVVEFLLLAQANPNCADRWGGTPLQDALSGQHIETAHILKAKGAIVSDNFGASAVCAAAGKGDVPKLRMLHSFGQSLDVGDYDDRRALHLATAEGKVLAVSFLLGISSDPNEMDRWGGTAMGTYAPAHVHSSIRKHPNARKRAHMLTRTHACTSSCTRPFAHTCTHARSHSNTHILRTHIVHARRRRYARRHAISPVLRQIVARMGRRVRNLQKYPRRGQIHGFA
jgi:ankyrin repeat protein